MARRYKRRTDWSCLRLLIESNLNDCEISSAPVKVDGRIDWIESGLSHENYRFWLAGDEWQDRPMLLRLNKSKTTGCSERGTVDITIKEAETLKVLTRIGFKYETPEFICMVKDEFEEPKGFIETIVHGIPIGSYRGKIHEDKVLPGIVDVAAAVHRLPTNQFEHLGSYGNSKAHVEILLDRLPRDLYKEFPSAQKAKEWIGAVRLNRGRPVVLHGDLLPQNVLSDPEDRFRLSVVDWEYAKIGDPAYDLAIVSRGNRRVLGKENGLKRLLKLYMEAGGQDITLSSVMAHELILVLNWIWESSESIKKGKQRGHGPEYYEQKMISILKRAEKLDE